MFQAIRTTARAVNAALNTCLNPTCLHSQRTKGCACCKSGCGSKKKTATRRKTSAKKR